MAKTINKVFTEYLCEICEQELLTLEGNGYIFDNDKAYCHKCAVLNGIIAPEEYLKDAGMCIRPDDFVYMKDGIIYVKRIRKNGVYYKYYETEVKQLYGNLHEN